MINSIVKRLLACAAAIAVTCITAQAKNVTFQKINLVSDLSNVAQIQDTSLVNAWGISPANFNSFSTTDFTTNKTTNYTDLITNLVVKAKHKTNIVVTTNFSVFTVTTTIIPATVTNSFFWISANGTGKALLYNVTNDALGVPVVVPQDLEVSIPGAGNPSGLVPNPYLHFNTNLFTTNVLFFVSEDGTISGWVNDSNDLPAQAVMLLAPSATNVYKGVTEVFDSTNGPVLLAANFFNGTVDEYAGTNMALIAQFSDPITPVGYAPFNIQILDGVILVTFAKQDINKMDDVPGIGNGVIDIFNMNTKKFIRFATGTGAGGKEARLNSPYGLALAPASWGNLADQLLVANFGDGTITVFNDNGKSKSQLEDDNNETIVIDGIWGLTFGNGFVGDPDDLYFTAGPSGESHGLFGVLQPPPSKKKKK